MYLRDLNLTATYLFMSIPQCELLFIDFLESSRMFLSISYLFVVVINLRNLVVGDAKS